MSIVLVVLCFAIVALSVAMLIAKNPISAAMSLLGILILTAGIYGLIGEHLIATLQLVVYAGAIMVLFIFSIMLLNLNTVEHEFNKNKKMFLGGIVIGFLVFGVIGFALNQHFSLGHDSARAMGSFSLETIKSLGGNTKVLSHALFSQYYLSFEVISLALLVAIVAAVVLAKRKVD